MCVHGDQKGILDKTQGFSNFGQNVWRFLVNDMNNGLVGETSIGNRVVIHKMMNAQERCNDRTSIDRSRNSSLKGG